MRCAHCCFACTSRGQDMSLETYKAALRIADDLDSPISIGGGEPTLHPLFWKFLALAIKRDNEVWLATNGSQTDDAIALAGLAKKGVIGCALSLDDYHDSIDPRVVAAFKNGKREQPRYHDAGRMPDLREIRDVTGREIKAGRQKTGRDTCPCDSFFVKPNGDIHICGCKRSPRMGNANEGFENIIWSMAEDEREETVECYRKLRRKGELVATGDMDGCWNM